MSRREQIALWVGGVTFGIMGAGVLVLFATTALEFHDQVAGGLWALGLTATGLAICRLASRLAHPEIE
ncbi:MAG: hypothetical protein ACOC7S_01870 [Planctomycetota bacterium]